jgi:HEAT repeat protein
MTPERVLVAQLGDKHQRLDAMRALLGAVNARELRAVHVSDAVFDALVDGLGDPSPVVRWWSVQLLDHCPEPRALLAVVPLLDDPVPRVRRNAAHALGCQACKPTCAADLPEMAVARLAVMAEQDTNSKVRAEARMALADRT